MCITEDAMAGIELEAVKTEVGEHLITPCAEVMVFSRTALAAGAQGMLAFYESFRKRWGGEATFYRTNTMTRAKKATRRTLEMLPFWLQDDKSLQEGLLGLHLHGGQGGRDYALPMFEMFSDQSNAEAPYSFFRMAFSLDWARKNPGALVDLTHEALATFPLHWGYAGYSLLWEEEEIYDEDETISALQEFMEEHPGLSYGDPFSFLARSRSGLIDVNWLTLLGPDCTHRLGGQQGLAKALPPQVQIQTLKPGGMLLQAGRFPVTGSAEEAGPLELYRAVGKAVRAIRAPREVIEDIWLWPLSDGREVEWLDRFFT
jgi:hypothetical protein